MEMRLTYKSPQGQNPTNHQQLRWSMGLQESESLKTRCHARLVFLVSYPTAGQTHFETHLPSKTQCVKRPNSIDPHELDGNVSSCLVEDKQSKLPVAEVP